MPAPENEYYPLPLYTPSTSPSPSDPPPYATGNQASTLSDSGRNESIPLDRLPKANQLDPVPLTTVIVEPHPTRSPRLTSHDASESESRTGLSCLSCATIDVPLESTPQTWECCVYCTSNLQGFCIFCACSLQALVDACTPVGVSLGECCSALLGSFMNKKVFGALFVLALFLLVSGKINVTGLLQAFTGNGGADKG